MMTFTTTVEAWSLTQVIALGYFDGPTEGVMKLGDGHVFRFSTVAQDVDRELRVCTLAELREDQFARLVQILSKALGPPVWPIWVPLWKFPDKDLQLTTEQSVDAIVDAAEIRGVAVCSDDLRRCLAIRSIDKDELCRVTSWFEFMNVRNGTV